MSEPTQLTEYVLKSGQGLFHGVSNDNAQKGKTLTLSDGDITICILPLDRAFPDIAGIVNGVKIFSPGMVLDVPFTRELRAKTDGQDLKFYWQQGRE